jgi:hypothetical protein
MQTRCSIGGNVGTILLLGCLGATLPACIEGPENGDVIAGTTLGKVLSFSGKHTLPGESVRIQVLKAPDDAAQNDPGVSANWVTIATATTSTSPLVWNDDQNPYYSWSRGVTPAPNGSLAARWPQGGILRFRAIAEDGTLFLTFDQDRLACYAAHNGESWLAIGDKCKSEFSVSAVVSPTPTPADLATPPDYLDFAAGVGSEAETELYYQQFDAPATLAAFRQRYGFGAPFTDEASAVYFNAGDLGTGREMHCKSVLQVNGPPLRACYVSNYGSSPAKADNFGGDPQAAVARAIAGAESGTHAGAFATVAMVYAPPITDDNSVRFMVYDANDQLATKAALDSTEHNTGIPQNCITCHGGANYSNATHRVRGAGPGQNGARFLAFDLDAFEFSTNVTYTRAAQQESFRKLNRIVSLAAPAAATLALIDGWYGAGGVSTPGTTADTSFVPAAFATVANDSKIYRDVVAPYCRACHAAQTGPLAFDDRDDFKALHFLIDFRTCTLGPDPARNHLMPNAEVTLKKFWASPARAYLAGYLDTLGSCKP